MKTVCYMSAAILDIPVYKTSSHQNEKIQALHVLFTLYSEFKNSQVTPSLSAHHICLHKLAVCSWETMCVYVWFTFAKRDVCSHYMWLSFLLFIYFLVCMSAGLCEYTYVYKGRVCVHVSACLCECVCVWMSACVHACALWVYLCPMYGSACVFQHFQALAANNQLDNALKDGAGDQLFLWWPSIVPVVSTGCSCHEHPLFLWSALAVPVMTIHCSCGQHWLFLSWTSIVLVVITTHPSTHSLLLGGHWVHAGPLKTWQIKFSPASMKFHRLRKMVSVSQTLEWFSNSFKGAVYPSKMNHL